MAPKRRAKPEDDDGEQAYQGLIGQATSGSRIGPRAAGASGERTRAPLAKLLFTFRYLVPGALVLFGVVYAIVDWPRGSDAFSLFAGAGLALFLLNVLYRLGVEGDFDRDAEEAARDYFSEHGVWPDEQSKKPREDRRWRLPDGVATPESEAAPQDGRRPPHGRP